ncbi:hypothetical protein INR49_021387 [Caranx melampygus]|nr:hypothetical protein INR49_021387 [Caranx melampygus]
MLPFEEAGGRGVAPIGRHSAVCRRSKEGTEIITHHGEGRSTLCASAANHPHVFTGTLRHQRVQTPETSQTSQTLQTPETLQTAQTPETLQTSQTAETSQTLQTPETSQTLQTAERNKRVRAEKMALSCLRATSPAAVNPSLVFHHNNDNVNLWERANLSVPLPACSSPDAPDSRCHVCMETTRCTPSAVSAGQSGPGSPQNLHSSTGSPLSIGLVMVIVMVIVFLLVVGFVLYHRYCKKKHEG